MSPEEFSDLVCGHLSGSMPETKSDSMEEKYLDFIQTIDEPKNQVSIAEITLTRKVILIERI